MKSGLYEGDLGLVEHVGAKEALIKLIPRIQKSTNAAGELKYNFLRKIKDDNACKIEVPKVMFNPTTFNVVAEINKVKDHLLNRNFYIWQE